MLPQVHRTTTQAAAAALDRIVNEDQYQEVNAALLHALGAKADGRLAEMDERADGKMQEVRRACVACACPRCAGAFACAGARAFSWATGLVRPLPLGGRRAALG